MGKDAAKQSTTPNEVQMVGLYGGALLDIGWRLFIVVISCLWAGTAFDRRYDTAPWGALTGFLLIIVSFVLIVIQILHRVPRAYGGLKK